MTQGDAERRAYARGYSRGRNRVYATVHRLLQIAKAYRTRLTDVTTGRTCENCRRWKRGCATCHWGYCNLDFEFGAEPRMWIDARDLGSRRVAGDLAIATTASFSCTCWLPIGQE